MAQKLITWPLLRTLGLYLGACWVAVEFADWIVARYSLPDRVVDLTLIGLLSFTPSVALLAWIHGEPGRQRVQLVEKIVVPANAVLSAGLLALLVFGRPFAAPDVDTVTVTAPDGETMTRPVVEAEQSRRLSLFFPDNRTGEATLDWVQYGVTIALDADLAQHDFVRVWTPFARMNAYSMFQLRKAGFDAGVGVPLALKRNIASEGNAAYFVDGYFERSGSAESDEDQIEIVMTLYDTQSTRAVQEIRRPLGSNGEALYTAVDEISQALIASLEVPLTYEGATDLPVASRLSESLGAFEAHVAAVTAQMLDNDRDAAQGHWRNAVELDPTFAVAQSTLGLSLYQSGRTEDAGTAFQQALRHDYKLIDAERFVARGLSYNLRGDRDSELATYQAWSELSPNEPLAFTNLGYAYLYLHSDPARALEAFERALDLDPAEQWTMLSIASVHEVMGNREAAVAYYTRYHEANPQDTLPLSKLGELHRREGDLESARGFFERAAIVARGLVDPTLNLADIALRQGRYDDALARLDQAQAIASSARQDAAVMRARLAYYAHRGQEEEYLALLPELADVSGQFLPPLDVLMGVWVNSIEHYATAGRVEEGLRVLAEHETTLQPPLNALVDIGYLMLAMEVGDFEAAKTHGSRVSALMQDLNLDRMAFQRAYYTGRISAAEGNLETAIEELELAHRLFAESVSSVQEERYALEIRTQLAEYYSQAGQTAKARGELADVLLRFPSHVRANIIMARLLQRSGDREAAESHLNAANTALAPADTGHPLLLAASDVRALIGT